MNNSLQIDNKLLSCRVAYLPVRGEREEGFVRACWLNSGGNLVFLLELDRGGFMEVLAGCCKRIM
jgi:hypothetical protein